MNQEAAKLKNEVLSSSSSVSIITGIILIIISIHLFANPGISILQLTTLLGIYLVVKGVFDFFTVFSSETKNRGLTLFAAILGFLAGLVILAHPLIVAITTVRLLVWLIALALIVNGISSMSESVVFGILLVIVGILLFFSSTIAVAAIFVWLMGLLTLFVGVSSMLLGTRLNFESKK